MTTLNNNFALSAGSIFKIGMGACLSLLWMLAIIVVFQVGSETILKSASGQNPPTVSSANDNLRYTTLGWQDPTDWLAQPQQGSRLNLGSVSPLIWAALLLLAVGIAVMWLSSDDEVERIFQERLEKAQLIAQWKSEQESNHRPNTK